MGRDQGPALEEDVAEEATRYAVEVPGLRHAGPGAAIHGTARGARGRSGRARWDLGAAGRHP